MRKSKRRADTTLPYCEAFFLLSISLFFVTILLRPPYCLSRPGIRFDGFFSYFLVIIIPHTIVSTMRNYGCCYSTAYPYNDSTYSTKSRMASLTTVSRNLTLVVVWTFANLRLCSLHEKTCSSSANKAGQVQGCSALHRRNQT